ETTTYFSPLARELGIGQLHRKLELWSFSLAHPALYRTIETVVKRSEKDFDQKIRRIKDTLDSKLREGKISRDRIDLSIEETVLFISRLIVPSDRPSDRHI